MQQGSGQIPPSPAPLSATSTSLSPTSLPPLKQVPLGSDDPPGLSGGAPGQEGWVAPPRPAARALGSAEVVEEAPGALPPSAVAQVPATLPPARPSPFKPPRSP